MISRRRSSRSRCNTDHSTTLRCHSCPVSAFSNPKPRARSFSNMSHMLSKQTDFLRAIKALRRSIKGEEKAKAHVSIGPKSAVAIVPPKKVRSLQPSPKPLCGPRGLWATCSPMHFNLHLLDPWDNELRAGLAGGSRAVESLLQPSPRFEPDSRHISPGPRWRTK